MKPLNLILLAVGITAVLMGAVVITALVTLKSTVITFAADGPAPSQAQADETCRLLNERIKAFGEAANVRSGKVERRGGEIVVTLRGYSDLSSFKAELLRQNRIEFYLAAEEPAVPAAQAAPAKPPAPETPNKNTAVEKALAAMAAGQAAPPIGAHRELGPLPAGYQRRAIVHEYVKLGTMDVVQKVEEPIYIRETPEMAIERLKSARLDRPGSDRLPVITIEFEQADAARFAEITRSNKGRRLALVIDGEIFSAPKIQDAITGGVVQVQNIVSANQATRLYHLLRIGSLPVPLKVVGILPPGGESKMITAK